MSDNRDGVVELECPECWWRVARVEWDYIRIDPGCPRCGTPWIYFHDVEPINHKHEGNDLDHFGED